MYYSFVEACATVKPGQTVKLLRNCSGAGVFVPAVDSAYDSPVTIDLNNQTYTCTGPAVGSEGTENQVLHFEKNNKIVIKNGTINVASDIADNTVRMIIQNYADLTLDGVKFDGTNLDKWASSTPYVMSNNNGTVVIKDTTITAPSNAVAFDVCSFGLYTGANVTVKGSSTINGTIEVSSASGASVENLALTITNGNFNGSISCDAALKDKVQITGGTFSSDPSEYVAENYVSVDNGDGTWSVLPRATIGTTYFAGGTGSSSESPFLVSSKEQLKNMSKLSNYSYFKWSGDSTISGANWATTVGDGLYLCGSFDGNGLTVENLDSTLFRSVWNGSNSWAPAEDTVNTYTISNLTVNKAKIPSTSWNAAVVRTVGVHNFIMDNVNVHGYIDGSTGVAAFVCFGPGNYDPSYQYDGHIKFKNCNSDMTIVATSGNAVGFVAHAMMESSEGSITLENSNYTGEMSASSLDSCKYICGNWINATIIDNQNTTKDNNVYTSSDNGWKYIVGGKVGSFTIEQQKKPENIGETFTVNAKEGATKAVFALQISPNPGNMTSVYMTENVNVSDNSFTTTNMKYFTIRINPDGVYETGAHGNYFDIVNPDFNGLGSNTIVRVTQYDDSNTILGITEINFGDVK